MPKLLFVFAWHSWASSLLQLVSLDATRFSATLSGQPYNTNASCQAIAPLDRIVYTTSAMSIVLLPISALAFPQICVAVDTPGVRVKSAPPRARLRIASLINRTLTRHGIISFGGCFLK